MKDGKERVVFLDWLRALACLMVITVHVCECFYFKGSDLFFASRGDAVWVTLIDSAMRASVPLFVMASAYLLFPLHQPTSQFLRRRLLRVGVPFLAWSGIYIWYAGEGGWVRLLFNFPDAAGHLWFVPMLFGVYLVMPLLSPWAERVGERELRWWLLGWFATTLLPFVREVQGLWLGAPSYGIRQYLWGECPWNDYGTLQYISGFVGYLMLGLYFRKFVTASSVARLRRWALPLGLAGYALVAGCFWARIPGGGYPVQQPYAAAVELELSWRFCSLGVALTAWMYFAGIYSWQRESGFYRRVIRPLAQASFGAYLLHMLLLPGVTEWVRSFTLLPTPLIIGLAALCTYVLSMLSSMLLMRIPWFCVLVGGAWRRVK